MVEVGILLLTLLLTFSYMGKKTLFDLSWKFQFVLFLLLYGFWAATSSLWSPNYLLTLGNALGLIIISITGFRFWHMKLENRVFFLSKKLVLDAIFVFAILLFVIQTWIERSKLWFNINWSSNRPRPQSGIRSSECCGELFCKQLALPLVFIYFLTANKSGDRASLFSNILSFLPFSFFLTNARAVMGATAITLLVMIHSSSQDEEFAIVGISVFYRTRTRTLWSTIFITNPTYFDRVFWIIFYWASSWFYKPSTGPHSFMGRLVFHCCRLSNIWGLGLVTQPPGIGSWEIFFWASSLRMMLFWKFWWVRGLIGYYCSPLFYCSTVYALLKKNRKDYIFGGWAFLIYLFLLLVFFSNGPGFTGVLSGNINPFRFSKRDPFLTDRERINSFSRGKTIYARTKNKSFFFIAGMTRKWKYDSG